MLPGCTPSLKEKPNSRFESGHLGFGFFFGRREYLLVSGDTKIYNIGNVISPDTFSRMINYMEKKSELSMDSDVGLL